MADQTPTPTPDDAAPYGQPGPAGQPAQPGQPGYQAPYQQPYGQPYQQPPAAYNAAPGQILSDADQRTYSTLTHVLGIFFSFIPSLIVYLVFKDRGEYVKYQAREALNFQLTMLIAYIVGAILTFVIIGIFVMLAVGVVTLIFSIMAAVATNRGEPYRYPLSIRMVS